jgi:Uma2 family endonuclease
MVTLHLRQLHVPPGQRVLVEDVSWPEFTAIIEELGEHRGTRIAYSQGTLEIVSPLPEHEKVKVVISDLIKVLLDELDMPWESLGSTTFRREDMAAGIEPDGCFYIQHQAVMVGKDRLDLTVDPPPDLVIEVDVTSPTALRAYEASKWPCATLALPSHPFNRCQPPCPRPSPQAPLRHSPPYPAAPVQAAAAPLYTWLRAAPAGRPRRAGAQQAPLDFLQRG